MTMNCPAKPTQRTVRSGSGYVYAICVGYETINASMAATRGSIRIFVFRVGLLWRLFARLPLAIQQVVQMAASSHPQALRDSATTSDL